MRLSSIAVANAKANTYVRNPSHAIDVSARSDQLFSGDLLVVPFYKLNTERGTKSLDSAVSEALIGSIPPYRPDLHKVLSDVLKDGNFKAEVGAKQLIRLYGENNEIKYLALVGLGPSPKKGKSGELEVKTAARLGKAVAALAKEVKAVSVAVSLPTGTDNAGVSPFLLAIQDSLYVDERFKKVPEEGFPKLVWKSLVLLGSTDSVVQNAALTNKLTNMVASGVQYAKDLVGKLHTHCCDGQLLPVGLTCLLGLLQAPHHAPRPLWRLPT
jgi:hypothetical protein